MKKVGPPKSRLDLIADILVGALNRGDLIDAVVAAARQTGPGSKLRLKAALVALDTFNKKAKKRIKQ